MIKLSRFLTLKTCRDWDRGAVPISTGMITYHPKSLGIFILKFEFKFASDWLIKYRLFSVFRFFSKFHLKFKPRNLIPPQDLVLNSSAFALFFPNMYTNQQVLVFSIGKNYNFWVDLRFTQLLFGHEMCMESVYIVH